MRPRYTYATTDKAEPPDTEQHWRLAHVTVVKSESGKSRDGTDTTWNYHEYVWECDSFDEAEIVVAPPRPASDTWNDPA